MNFMKINKLFFLIIFVIIITTNLVQAEEIDNIMKTQEDSLGITDFIQESNSYFRKYFSNCGHK